MDISINMNQINFTLEQVLRLLDEQKRIVVEELRGRSAYYNKESTEGHHKTLPIDEQKFSEVGLLARYPNDIITLKRYLQ